MQTDRDMIKREKKRRKGERKREREEKRNGTLRTVRETIIWVVMIRVKVLS